VKIINVIGARPNFIKIAPLIREMQKYSNLIPLLVHTGQHYDASLAGQFFQDLHIPEPNVFLDVGSGSHAYQTAEVMKRIEPVCAETQPDMVVVVGDVNSTLAAALTASKLQIPVAHVEAGLRSFDRTMPEEINRMVTDAVSDYLFVSEESGVLNLRREGVEECKIHFVGNVMIDSLVAARQSWSRSSIHEKLRVRKGSYGVITLHRPSNVDDPIVLRGLIKALGHVSRSLPLIFPVHPRTRNHLETLNGTTSTFFGNGKDILTQGINYVEPMGYVDFMALVSEARVVLTDSGGIQEETTVLGIPCLTLRDNTERPVTVTHGTNRIIGSNPKRIIDEAIATLNHTAQPERRPPLWDGHASGRIIQILLNHRPREVSDVPVP